MWEVRKGGGASSSRGDPRFSTRPVVYAFKILKPQTGQHPKCAFRIGISIKMRFEPVRITFGSVRTCTFHTRISIKMGFELVRIPFGSVRTCKVCTRTSIKLRFELARITFGSVRTCMVCARISIKCDSNWVESPSGRFEHVPFLQDGDVVNGFGKNFHHG